MNREEKKVVIDSLAEKLTAYAHYYITDTSEPVSYTHLRAHET